MIHWIASLLFPLPNDLVLAISLLGLLACFIAERRRVQVRGPSVRPLGSGAPNPRTSVRSYITRLCTAPFYPVIEGRPATIGSILSLSSIRKFTPLNAFRSEINSSNLKQKRKGLINKNGMFPEEVKEKKTMQSAIGLSMMKGCEVDGPAFLEMKKTFPDIPDPDIMRFLIARKGNSQLAREMLEKYLLWSASNVPLKRSDGVSRAISAKCFYPHGFDRDGAPIVCFVGAFYDSKKAESEHYIMLAAHVIDWVCRRTQHTSFTVLVHVDKIDGAPNEPTNIEFVKGFVKVLSDNFPERLKRLVLYPFPYFGNIVWSAVKMFIDPRTADKVQLISGDGRSIPTKVESFIDPKMIPPVLGGQDDRPIIDLELTLAS